MGEAAASGDDRRVPVSADTRGKRRILAELKRLEQKARFLEEELEELQKTERVSAAALQENYCKKLKAEDQILCFQCNNPSLPMLHHHQFIHKSILGPVVQGA